MNNLELIKRKIISLESLERQLFVEKFKGTTVVFTNGCFDVLHLGHVEYLAKAADLGNYLIIGLNSDASVRRLKGENRPVNNFEARALLLAAMSFVSAIVEFTEDTPENIIKKIKPGILTKGGDYKESQIVGSDFVKTYGGKIEIIPFTEGYSSTSVLEKLK